ncbi:MAG: hypothetical protein JNL42_18940 [Anaerolineae bacterium]|nr:hypothetical protein [Anaerolineae bacterium]
MTVTAKWYDAKPETNIIHIEFVGAWTWDEFQHSIEEDVGKLLGGGEDKRCTIVDLRQSTRLPPDVIKQSSKMARGGQDWDLMVIVGNNQFARMVISIVTRLFPNLGKAFQMATTLDEAVRLIDRHRATHV